MSPNGNILYTADPDAANQILRGNAFGKPADLMRILNVFGPTITGTDGEETRLYRKVAAPFFNEHTLAQVWKKSIEGAEMAMKVVFEGQAAERKIELRPVVARLSLYLLNAVCFGSDRDCLKELQDRGDISDGHRLSYCQAMHSMLDYFATVFFTPSLLLSIR